MSVTFLNVQHKNLPFQEALNDLKSLQKPLTNDITMFNYPLFFLIIFVTRYSVGQFQQLSYDNVYLISSHCHIVKFEICVAKLWMT